jgi:hypothetical protein
MGFSKKDFIEIARQVFAGVLFISIVQKIINPIHYENFSDFIILLINILIDKDYSSPIILFVFIIVLEGLIILGLFHQRFFQSATTLGIILISFGVMASGLSFYYDLKSSCGCGLFGDIPLLLLAQKLFLLFLLVFLHKNRKLLFNSKQNGMAINKSHISNC